MWSVLEWTGDKNTVRHVELRLNADQRSIAVLSHTESVLRTIDLTRHSKLMIWTTSDKHRNHLLIHVPREYDLVLICYDILQKAKLSYTYFIIFHPIHPFEIGHETMMLSVPGRLIVWMVVQFRRNVFLTFTGSTMTASRLNSIAVLHVDQEQKDSLVNR